VVSETLGALRTSMCVVRSIPAGLKMATKACCCLPTVVLVDRAIYEIFSWGHYLYILSIDFYRFYRFLSIFIDFYRFYRFLSIDQGHYFYIFIALWSNSEEKLLSCHDFLFCAI
jgi:hypothetical protein